MQININLKEETDKDYYITKFCGSYFLGQIFNEEEKIERKIDLNIERKLCTQCNYRKNTNNFLKELKEELLDKFINLFEYILNNKNNLLKKEEIVEKDLIETISYNLKNNKYFLICYYDKIYLSNDKCLKKNLGVNIINLVYKGENVINFRELLNNLKYKLNNKNFLETSNSNSDLIFYYNELKSFFYNNPSKKDFLNCNLIIGKFFYIPNDKYKIIYSKNKQLHFYKKTFIENKKFQEIYYSLLEKQINNFQTINYLNDKLENLFKEVLDNFNNKNIHKCNYFTTKFNKKNSSCKLQRDIIINKNSFDIKNYFFISNEILREKINELFRNKSISEDKQTFYIKKFITLVYRIKNFGIFKKIIEEDEDIIGFDNLILKKLNEETDYYYPLLLGNVNYLGNIEWGDSEEIYKSNLNNFDLEKLFNLFKKIKIKEKEPILFYDKKGNLEISNYPFNNFFLYIPYGYDLNLLCGRELFNSYPLDHYVAEYSFKIKSKKNYRLKGILITENYLNSTEEHELIKNTFFKGKEHYIYILYKRLNK